MFSLKKKKEIRLLCFHFFFMLMISRIETEITVRLSWVSHSGSSNIDCYRNKTAATFTQDLKCIITFKCDHHYISIFKSKRPSAFLGKKKSFRNKYMRKRYPPSMKNLNNCRFKQWK